MSGPRDAARRLAALPFWYVTRRFATLQDHLDHQLTLLGERFEAAVDPERVAGSLHRELSDIHLAQEHVERLARRPPWTELVGAPVSKLDEMSAAFLNYGAGPHGFAAQAGLWLAPEVSLAHSTETVDVLSVDPRVATVAYVHRALAGLAPGAAVLDVGATGSTLALALASSGFAVTALDPRPYRLEHPGITPVASRVEEWDGPAGAFDAIVAHLVMEHVGLGAYGRPEGPPGADIAAMQSLRRLARPEAVLVLAAAYGARGDTWDHRVYDSASLAGLLEGWSVGDQRFVRRVAPTAWTPCTGDEAATETSVVMVTATPA
ncbi:MAG: hypothetical protein QOE92_355 [Chloroflexota bacterium]|nr:hypothetical protein [Chloroflexota bacterium]